MRALYSAIVVVWFFGCSSSEGGDRTKEASNGGGAGETTEDGGRSSSAGARQGGAAGRDESIGDGGTDANGGATAERGGATGRGGSTTTRGGATGRGGTSARGGSSADSGGRPEEGGRAGEAGTARGGAAGEGEGGSSRATGGTTQGSGGLGEGGSAVGGSTPIPSPVCAADGGTERVEEPVLVATLSDRWHEAWLGSPAVVDLDQDGENEILVPRDDLLLGWHMDGTVVFRAQTSDGRIWASPVVADLLPESPGLEVAVASRGKVYVWDASGNVIPGFPTSWQDELRAISAGDIDGDGALELVVVTTSEIEEGSLRDIITAYELDGSVVAGFPPNTTGSSGCDERCYTHGGFDQTLALGDLDGDGTADIFAPQDNAYVSLHRGNGYAFDSNPMFESPTKTNGVRFLHVLAEAQQGYAEDEETALQAHFTNTAPAIVDLDGDGTLDLVMLGSVQNASQTDRYKGVGLWAIHPDGTRLLQWTEPLHFPDYLAGLWDYEDTNVVGATNQISVADLDPTHAGPELVFAGFDGRIHAVSADRQELWSYTYTTDERVLTGGVLVVDLSKDGVPEIVLNSYSPDTDKGALFVLDALGNELYQLPLPDRGAMPVPTAADVDQDGTLELVVSLKDGIDGERQVLVYEVPGSGTNCLPWPTGRGNYLRDGLVASSKQ
jgi:hypothetical protein